MNLAILLPTYHRPEGLRRVLLSLANTASYCDVYIAREFNDFIAYDMKHEFKDVLNLHSRVCEKENQGPAYAWNMALQHAENVENNKKYDAYFLASDDMEFLPEWYEYLEVYLSTRIPQKYELVGVNEGQGKFDRTGWTPFYAMTRDFIVNHNGGVAACPHYKADFVDVEACERAKRDNVFGYCEQAKVIHHWREIDDEGYKKADPLRKEMKLLYEQRKANGFPNDYLPVIEKEKVKNG